MKIKELYQAMPGDYKDILKQVNSYVIGNLWSTQPGDVSLAQRTALSNNIWASALDRDVSITIINYCDLNNIDINNLTVQQAQAIYVMIFMKYADKWRKLWTNIYLQEYNPIWNYDGSNSVVRTYEYGKKETETKDFSIEHEKDSSDTETVTNNITDNAVYGFNSSAPVGASKNTNNGTRETEYAGSDTDIHSGTDEFQQSGVDTERITETKGGNQGTTTTQYMLSEEERLRREFLYWDIVCKDIIQALSINIY